MKTLLKVLSVLVLALPSFTLSAQTQSSLFEAHFENGRIPYDLGVTSAWEVVEDEDGNEVLHAVSHREVEAFHLYGGEDWKNYIYELKVKIIRGAVYLRARTTPVDFCNAYVLRMKPATQQVMLGQENVGDCELSALDSLNRFNFSQDEWLTVQLIVEDNEITGVIEGVELSGHSLTYQQGSIGLVLETGSEVQVDDIHVIPLPEIDFETPQTLRDYNQPHPEAIAELEALGVIPEGSRLLFAEPYTFITGQGNYFYPLAERSPFQDIIMAGEITFEVGSPDKTEFCGFSARITYESPRNSSGAIELSLMNDGNVFLASYYATNKVYDWVFSLRALELDLAESHHVLIILIRDQATIYIDGQLAFDHYTVEDVSGSYGISLLGGTGSSRCEGRNVWVYRY